MSTTGKKSQKTKDHKRRPSQDSMEGCSTSGPPSSCDFDLQYLQEQLRDVMKDSQAKLTLGNSWGKVCLEVQLDSLFGFLDSHRAQKAEMELSLKSQLRDSQVSLKHCEKLQLHLSRNSAMLHQAQACVEEQALFTKKVLDELKKAQDENEALQRENQKLMELHRAETVLEERKLSPSNTRSSKNLKVIQSELKDKIMMLQKTKASLMKKMADRKTPQVQASHSSDSAPSNLCEEPESSQNSVLLQKSQAEEEPAEASGQVECAAPPQLRERSAMCQRTQEELDKITAENEALKSEVQENSYALQRIINLNSMTSQSKLLLERRRAEVEGEKAINEALKCLASQVADCEKEDWMEDHVKAGMWQRAKDDFKRIKAENKFVKFQISRQTGKPPDPKYNDVNSMLSYIINTAQESPAELEESEAEDEECMLLRAELKRAKAINEALKPLTCPVSASKEADVLEDQYRRETGLWGKALQQLNQLEAENEILLAQITKTLQESPVGLEQEVEADGDDPMRDPCTVS